MRRNYFSASIFLPLFSCLSIFLSYFLLAHFGFLSAFDLRPSDFLASCFLHHVLRAVRRPLWPREHRVGLGIIRESLLLRVPTQFAAQLHRDPAQDTAAGRAMRLLRRRDGRFASLHAGEPIEVMIVAFVQPQVIRAERRVEQLRIAGIERFAEGTGGIARGRFGAAAADKYPALRTLELHAVGEVIVNDHGHAIRVLGLNVIRPMHVPEALLRKLRLALDGDGAGLFSAHAPMRDIHVMRTPAGDHAQAVRLDAQPTGPVHDVRAAVLASLRMDALLIVRSFGRTAEPHVVIQIRRDLHFGLTPTARVRGQTDANVMQLADAPVADQLAGEAELPRRALLAAYLEGAAFGFD